MRQNPHVRICGGPGSATTLVYPTARRHTGVRRVEHHQTRCDAASGDAPVAVEI